MFEGERERKNEQKKIIFENQLRNKFCDKSERNEKREKLRWNFCVNINVIETT